MYIPQPTCIYYNHLSKYVGSKHFISHANYQNIQVYYPQQQRQNYKQVQFHSTSRGHF